MKTEILRPADMERAIRLLKAGENVIFPTETVYGLGADITSEKALQGIFEAKGRPQDNPLIVHIGHVSQVQDLAFAIPAVAYTLMEAFWPGPLTIALKKKPWVSDTVTAGLKSVGIRMPSHPTALRLLQESGLFIAAPSANPSGSPSPTREEHVLEMRGRVAGILLDGACEVGLESTFLDLSTTPPRLLRPGAVTYEVLKAFLPDLVLYEGSDATASPGRKYRHYAPKTPVTLLKGSQATLARFMANHPKACFFVGDDLYQAEENQVRFIPDNDLREAFRQYYHLLRSVDTHYEHIYIPVLEPEGLARALMDRLTRSAEGRVLELHEGVENETDHRQ